MLEDSLRRVPASTLHGNSLANWLSTQATAALGFLTIAGIEGRRRYYPRVHVCIVLKPPSNNAIIAILYFNLFCNQFQGEAS